MLRLLLMFAAIAGLAACDSKTDSSSKEKVVVIEKDPPPGIEKKRISSHDLASGEKQESMPQQPPAQPPPRREDVYPQMKEYVVKPVEGEPAWPSPADEKAVAERGFVPFKGGYQYELLDDKGRITQAGVVVDGTILYDHGIMELLGCGPGGKDHESVLRLDADVQGLDLSLTLCGLKRGPLPGQLVDPKEHQGDRVIVLFQWENEEKKTVTHRAEDCVVNIPKKAPMPRVGWTYVGAMLPVPDPAATAGKTYRVLAASGTRSILTTYRDPTTLLDNPLFDAVDDSLYMANYMILPPPDTKIRVILRAPDEATRKEIEKLEQEAAK